MDKVEAFIFNSSTHWFAIRKIVGIWFNLNSTNSNPGPEIMSDFLLSAFIMGSEQEGYTNFLVKNLPKLKDLDAYIYSNLQKLSSGEICHCCFLSLILHLSITRPLFVLIKHFPLISERKILNG